MGDLRRRIEGRERIVKIVDEIEREGGDPFLVNVPHVLEDLAEDYDSSEPELLRSDSRAIESLSKLVKMQEEWVDARLLATISPESLKRRVEDMDSRSLAAALMLAQKPAVSVSSTNARRILEGIKYWESLKPRREERRTPPPIAHGTTVEPERFDEMLKGFEEEISREISTGWIELSRIAGRGKEEHVKRLYMLAHLATRGVVALRFDPGREEYLVGPAQDGGGRPASIVIEVD